MPRALGQDFDFRERVIVHIDDVVQEADRQVDRRAQGIPVDLAVGRLAGDERGKVEGSEVAGLAGQERLSPKQAAWGRRMLVKYRRQLPPRLYELAINARIPEGEEITT